MPLQDRIAHLQAGDVLVREGSTLPKTIRVSTSVVEGPWRVLEAIRSAQLSRQLEQAHWQFFFVPPGLRAKAFGFGRPQALARALRKIRAKADLAGLNTVEITSINTKELPGIHFACIEARLHHIQQGLVLTPEKQGAKTSGTSSPRPPSPEPVRRGRLVPHLANRLRDCLPHFRRNFNF